MCPACIANMAVMVLGLTSIGGLTAFTWKAHDKQDSDSPDKISCDQGEHHADQRD